MRVFEDGKSLQSPDVLLAMKIAVRVSEAAITGKDYLPIIQEMLDIVKRIHCDENIFIRDFTDWMKKNPSLL